MRRLLVLCSAMVFFDVAFYAAIAPLLPDYVARFDLSKAEAGVLAAAYAVGTLLASLPAGFVAMRVGPRRTVIAGLLLLGVASAVFGFGQHIVLLDSARFVQGIAGALIWSGALSWLITTAPAARRGSLIGVALGTAVAGALIGPLLGAIAAEVGTKPVFGSMLGVGAVLAILASTLPEGAVPEREPLRQLADTVFSRPIVATTGFIAVPSLMFGAVGVLVPLKIHSLGGGHAVIAGGFIAGAALEAGLAPIVGRYSDRVGRRLPFVAGIAICAVTTSGIALASGLGVLMAALILTSLGAGLAFTPALTALSEAADSSRLHQGFAAGLSNTAWSAGQSAGALAGGGIAAITGYTTPMLAVTALLAFTAVYAYRALPSTALRRAEAG